MKGKGSALPKPPRTKYFSGILVRRPTCFEEKKKKGKQTIEMLPKWGKKKRHQWCGDSKVRINKKQQTEGINGQVSFAPLTQTNPNTTQRLANSIIKGWIHWEKQGRKPKKPLMRWNGKRRKKRMTYKSFLTEYGN